MTSKPNQSAGRSLFRESLRPLLTALVVLGAAYGALVGPAAAQTAASTPKELRIGYQKYGTLVILKARGSLEKRLADKGVAVKWTEFPFGPPLLEAINVGSIDVGTVGESPPIFAQGRCRPCLCGQRTARAARRKGAGAEGFPDQD